MPSSRPWLSILVPAHNVQPYLGQCLESIHRGAGDGIEVIVLDDGSADGTAAVAREWLRRLPRGRLVELPSSIGVANARNRLVAEAAGDYVWFVDSDDLVLPGAIARLEETVERLRPDLVMCDFVSFRSDPPAAGGRVPGKRQATFAGPSGRLMHDHDALVAGLFTARQFHVWSKIARREIWADVRFPAGRVFEDNAAIPDLLAGVGSWLHVPEAWIGYRRRAGSIMSTIDRKRARDFVHSIDGLHRKVMPTVAGAGARFAVDYFCLRGFAWVSHRIEPGDGELWRQCADTLRRLYPDGIGGVQWGCVRRGWLLRALRLGRAARRINAVAASFPESGP